MNIYIFWNVLLQCPRSICQHICNSLALVCLLHDWNNLMGTFTKLIIDCSQISRNKIQMRTQKIQKITAQTFEVFSIIVSKEILKCIFEICPSAFHYWIQFLFKERVFYLFLFQSLNFQFLKDRIYPIFHRFIFFIYIDSEPFWYVVKSYFRYKRDFYTQMI